jgi:threonine/homoserine/homoserine lactone efflux protein
MVLSGIVLSARTHFLLWWAFIGLGFIMQSYDSLGYAGVATYYFGHISADFLWYGTISVVVGVTRKFIKEKPYRIMIAALGVLLVFFGVKFVWGAVGTLLPLI